MKPTEILNIKLLSNYLKIDKDDLLSLINQPYVIASSTDFSNNVLEIKQYNLLKKRGGKRIVYSANSDTLTNCLKILNNKLKEIHTPSDCVHGFVKGKSIKTNASNHLTKKIIFKVDILDFFGSITRELISKELIKLGFNSEISNAISKIVTYENRLVQGFHTSPTIANLCFKDIDAMLLSIDNSITYTRYADDLYFSSDSEFDVNEKVSKILEDNGFKINHFKTKVMRRGGKQFVTGLTVSDYEYPRIPKNIKRKLRQEIHYISKYGYKGHVLHKLGISAQEYNSDSEKKILVDSSVSFINNRIYGWLLYINSVEPIFAKKCNDKLYNK